MTVCTQNTFEFPVANRRRVQARFTGGDVSSDGGLVLVRQADRRLKLTTTLAKRLGDPRDPTKVIHPLETLLRQRLYGLCQGDADLNDHDRRRTDVALPTAVEQDHDLASASTLCRWENGADRQAAWLVHQWWIEQFIASHAPPPAELGLDLDATDDPLHGKQEGAFFHGYYGHYCFLPLYVFCGERLLVAYLRPSNIDAARHAWAITALLVKRLRQAWPTVKIIRSLRSGRGATVDSVVGGCCGGVTNTRCMTSWGWPRTTGFWRWRNHCWSQRRPSTSRRSRSSGCLAHSSTRRTRGIGRGG